MRFSNSRHRPTPTLLASSVAAAALFTVTVVTAQGESPPVASEGPPQDSASATRTTPVDPSSRETAHTPPAGHGAPDSSDGPTPAPGAEATTPAQPPGPPVTDSSPVEAAGKKPPVVDESRSEESPQQQLTPNPTTTGATAPDTAKPIEPTTSSASSGHSQTPVLHRSAAELEDGPIEVVVVGSRESRAPGSVHVIGRKQLERFRRDDPNAIVLQAPGVYVRQEDGVGLRPNIGIRGANSDRSKKITLTEDGVLFGPAPYSAPAAYYFPLMARMVSVGVVKGPAAIAHGPNTVGGAIDFLTQPIPAEPNAMFDLSLGEYGFVKNHGSFGASTDEFGFFLEGVRLHDEGFKELPNGADTGSTRNDWMVKASYEPDPLATHRQLFSLKLGYSDEVSNETYLGLSDEDFRANPDQRYAASSLDQMKNHRTSIVLHHRVDVEAAGASVDTDLYRNDFARIWRKANSFRGANLSGVLKDPDDPANAQFAAVLRGQVDAATAGETLLIGPNDRAFVSQGVQSKLKLKPTSGPLNHRVEVGVRLHNDSITRRHSQTGYVMTNGVLVPESSPEEVTAANRASSIALAMHALDAVTWQRLTLTPAVRFELIRSRFDDHVTEATAKRWVRAWMPGIGAYYAVTERFGLLAGAYRGFSPPAPGSDARVRPEYSVNTEAGLRYSDAPARAEAVAFHNDYQNLTDICTLSSGCSSDNLDRQFDAGRARIMGVEAHVAHEPSFGPLRLPLLLSYTLTRARFDNSFTSNDPIFGEVTTGDELPYVPRHQLVASAGMETDRAGVALGANYIAPMREEPGRGSLDDALATDEQFWLDASASFRPHPAITCYANVRNLLNSRRIVARRPYGARPNAPRWIQLGARLDY